MKRVYFLLELRVIMIIMTGLLFTAPSFAQWSTNPNLNNPICTAADDQISFSIAGDGAGGAIIAWEDYRGGNYDIYAQRISASGVVLWTANGIPISTAARDQTVPGVVSDGEGGAIIAWTDFRSGTYSDIYAQRINSNGTVLWTANGASVCAAANSQHSSVLVYDGAGGAIITWNDSRNGKDVYAQRISAAGQVMWASDGVSIGSAPDKQENPSIATDGVGGAIIAWQDNRYGDYDIYAQHINATGLVLWGVDGISICNALFNQVYPSVMSSGTGEVIISWQDVRNGTNADIYSQRIIVSGEVQWTNNGVAICTAANGQSRPVMTSDGAGGAIIAWWDYRPGNWDIYARKILASGAAQWTDNGVAIAVGTQPQMDPAITSDRNGGAIITWREERSGYYDIFAQRIDANGSVKWPENGNAVCTAANDQHPPEIVSDGAGGGIIAWWDYRNGLRSDIYAQQINISGQLGVITEIQDDLAALPESIRLDQNYPNPFRLITTIRFFVPRCTQVSLKVHNLLGQEVALLVNEIKPPGLYEVNWNASNLKGGLYVYQITVGDQVERKKLILLQ